MFSIYFMFYLLGIWLCIRERKNGILEYISYIVSLKPKLSKIHKFKPLMQLLLVYVAHAK